MVPRAFPFPLRIGTDICQISRIRRIILGPSARRFMMRVLAPGEQRPPQILEALRLVEAKETAGQDAIIDKCATWMAGRWAAKEAVIKAHKRKLFMQDILIARNSPSETENNPPVALLRHQHEDRVPDRESVVQLSISHDGDYATATCLAYDPWAEDDWLDRWSRIGARATKSHKNLPMNYKAKGVNRRYKKLELEEARREKRDSLRKHFMEAKESAGSKEEADGEEVIGRVEEEGGLHRWVVPGFKQTGKT